VLLPKSGAAATFGAPLQAGVQLAIGEINAAGGVNGHPVEVVSEDVGSDESTAAVAVSKLLASDVDAIVGTASSNIELDVLGTIVGAGVVSCSPTASAISLTSFPSHGLFFRTIPSDALQATAMAGLIDQSGRRSTAVFYPDDTYGTSFFGRLTNSLATYGIAVTAAPFDPAADDLSDVVVQALGTNPEVLTIVGDAPSGTRLLSTLQSLTASKPNLIRPIVVSDAMRRADIADAIGASSPLIGEISGTAPDSAPDSDAFAKDFASDNHGLPSTYASYSYDCANLIALAGLSARSDQPSQIAKAVVDVSRSGTNCSGFKECAALLADSRNIDYVGASGPVDLNEKGDVSVGRFEQFNFDPAGRDVTTADFVVNG
jgi:branched-chain amino acid transport system substrate-binding protein